MGWTELIDSDFTGIFKSLAINDEYVVMSNGTLKRKWKPGWTGTYQWGLNTPPTPTIAAGVAGTLTGDFYVAVAYQNELGNYGPFTEYAGPVTLAAESMDITVLTPDTDAQTVKRRLVILGGSLTQPMVFYLEDNTSTSMNYDGPLEDLVTVEQYFNNYPPPDNIQDMAEISGRIFAVCGNSDLFYNEAGMYEGFPLTYYRTIQSGEQLYQVSLYSEGYVATRGKGREFLTQITSTEPAYWQTIKGAPQGAVSSRLLLESPTDHQVFMSERGFYASGPPGRGEYLEKINPVIDNPSSAFGDMIPDRAYIWFKDKTGTGRVLRIDYRLGRPVAHYVANLDPTVIFADNIANKVYYAVNAQVKEFDAGDSTLPVLLTIPGQLCGSARMKDFISLIYELTGTSLSLSLVLDRITQSGSYTLSANTREETPTGLPPLTGQHLGLTLSSNAGDDFIIYLPWILEQVPV